MKTPLIGIVIALITALTACTPAPTHRLRFAVSEVTVAQGTSTTLAMSIEKLDAKAGDAQITLVAAPPGVTVTPAQAVVSGNSLNVTISVASNAPLGKATFGYEPNPCCYGVGANLMVNVVTQPASSSLTQPAHPW
jgi:hypothetical protein